jgi:cell division protein FtsQ
MSNRLNASLRPRAERLRPERLRPERLRPERLRPEEPLGAPRVMADAAQRGNRRRAWPRWTRPAMRLGVVAAPLAVAVGLGWGLWASGTLTRTVDGIHDRFVGATGALGFTLAQVMVEGRVETPSDTIMDAIGVSRGDPIFGVDLTATRQRLMQLPWVTAATVERRLPGVIYVQVAERQPMAVWQHDRQFTVIDRNGRPLADAMELARHGSRQLDLLPHVVGVNAPAQVPKLLAALERVPAIQARVSAATWVADRRWDLKLDNAVVVKLPESGMLSALRQLAEMDANGKVLQRDVVVVDLRQPDRMVLQAAAVPPPEPKKRPGEKI